MKTRLPLALLILVLTPLIGAAQLGSRPVPEWIARYGDPRGKSIDEVVDWIESIPFSETRGYVQRVMENYQIYKSRLGQSADIEHDLRFGRG